MSARNQQAICPIEAALQYSIASDKFGELAVLFDTIARHLNEHDNMYKLAKLGKDVALDYENQAGCWQEKAEGKQ